MKNKKLVVLLSALVLATAPIAVATTACKKDPEPTPGPVQKTEYTFTFVGGTGAQGTAPAAVTKESGETLTLPANPFTKDGYTFAGWSDGTAATPYAAGATYTVGTSNVTFTAQWTAIDYTVSFAGGEGATGEVAAIGQKHIGDKVTLPANGFTKTGYAFLGWSDGTTAYGAGDEITIGTSNVSFTAVWGEEYTDGITGSTTLVISGTKAIVKSKESYGNKTFEAVYDYAVNGDKVTLTSEDETVYTGDIVDGTIIVVLPVRISQWAAPDTALVLTKETLTLIEDMGSQGFSQTTSMSDYIYLFTNGLIVAETGTGVKYGTYTKVTNHVYNVTFAGNSKAYELKISLQSGVSFYSFNDGYNGEYIISGGSTRVTLDGYGSWASGTYNLITDGSSALIYLINSDELTEKLYSVGSSNILIPVEAEGAGVYLSKAEYPAFEKIIFNGTDLAGMVSVDEGNNEHVTSVSINGSTPVNVQVDAWTTVTVKFVNKTFVVRTEYATSDEIYTLNGESVPVDPTPAVDLEAGDYVNNIDSSVTATIATTASGTTLTLTKSSRPVEYQVTAGDSEGTYTFTQINATGTPVVATGSLVDGVLFISSIKAGSSTVVVALSKTALEKIDNVSAGYVANPLKSDLKLYLYKNNFAVCYTGYSAAKCGAYTVSGDIYTIAFTDGTTGDYKVTVDNGSVKATYIAKDAYAKTYTLGGKSYVLDGFGGYAVDSTTGKYVAGSAGFTIVGADGTYTPYTVEGDTATEATTPVVGEINGVKVHNVSPSTVNTALANNGIVLDENVEVYVGTGCARITYTVDGGAEQTALVALGYTVEINGITFTAITLNDNGKVYLQFMDGTTTRKVYYAEAAG